MHTPPQDPTQPQGAPQGWAAHARATLRIGLPLIAAQIAQMAMTVTDTVMLGWYGPETLAASVLGTTLYFIAFVTASGFAHGVMPLAAAAEGAEDPRGVRRAVRMGLWVIILGCAALMPVLWQTGFLLGLMGQDTGLSAEAQAYMRIAQWALFPALAIMVLRSYLAALERTGVVMWATIAGVLLNIVLNYAFIFGNYGAPELGIRGAAVATLVAQAVTLGLITLYCATLPALKKYTLFLRFFRPDWAAFREVVRIGLPISGTLLAEVGLFAASSIMMGWLGTVPLAAHGIALQVVSVIFMIPFGLSSAATARVGRALGRRDGAGLARAAHTVLAMAVTVAVLAAIVLWTVPEVLIALFLAEDEPAAPAILQAGAALLAVAAVFQIVDTLQVISVSLLRGIRDTRRPMLIAVFSYWGLGVPSAYLLGFTFGFGGPGVWAGLAVGLFFAATLLTRRFLRREALGLVAI